MHRLARSLFLCAASLCALLLPVAGLSAADPRVVAVGDIHGEYDGFVSILQKAGLIDAKLRWKGGKATFVQVGDYLDRGPQVRRVMDLLMDLERGAAKKRGKTVVLLGNHEVMNLTSVLHEADPSAYAAFADRRSEKRRQAAWAQYAALHGRLSERYAREPWPLLDESAWNEKHPLGFVEFQEALGRDGKYGRWLRNRPTVARVGKTVFVHGGISPEAKERTIEEINRRVQLEIEAMDRVREYLVAEKLILPFFTYPEILAVVDLELAREGEMPDDLLRVLRAAKSMYQWTIYSPDGPLWFRGFGEWGEEEGREKVAGLLSSLGARRIVVGHSILEGGRRIVPRFGNTVFLIDTGMLRGYAPNGRPSALEIVGDRTTAIYEDGRVSLDEPVPPSNGRGATPPGSQLAFASLAGDATPPDAGAAWRGPDGSTLPFRTAAQVEAFLRESKLVSVYKQKLSGATAPQKVLVKSGKVRANGVFRSYHREEENARWESGRFTEFLRDTYRSELAAYELSLLLGLDNVPPTVPWELKGQPGSLQLWIEKARAGWHPSEAEEPSDPALWAMESDRMLVFDALIGNRDRHEGNVLIDSAGKVWWIDHSRAFGRERDLPAERIQRCERRIREGLKALDPAVAAERLAPYMGPLEVDALLERRKRLLALVEERIAQHGEAAVLYTIEPGPPLRSVSRSKAPDRL
jgi:hypothetical protein